MHQKIRDRMIAQPNTPLEQHSELQHQFCEEWSALSANQKTEFMSHREVAAGDIMVDEENHPIEVTLTNETLGESVYLYTCTATVKS